MYFICQLRTRLYPSAVQNMTTDVSGLKKEVAEVTAQLRQHQADTQTTVQELRAEVQGMQQALQAALQRKQSADWFLQ